MKISIGEDLSEITLLQFQKYEKHIQGEVNLLEKIQIFTGVSQEDLSKLPLIELQEFELLIDKALNTPQPFKDSFTLGGVEFGFIPNFDKITFSEFKNLSEYGEDVENLHKTMAILFRPIVKKFSFIKTKLYDIVPYEGTEKYAEIMKLMPLNIVTGALFFFVNLSNELIKNIQKSTKVQQVRDKSQATIL